MLGAQEPFHLLPVTFHNGVTVYILRLARAKPKETVKINSNTFTDGTSPINREDPSVKLNKRIFTVNLSR